MATIVVTGLEPWEGVSENPTLAVLARLGADKPFGNELVAMRFPVDSERIPALVADALDRDRPALWLSLGLAPGSAVVAVERLAANVIDYPVADNAGNRPRETAVVAGAPVSYAATIPVAAVAAAIRQRGIPVKVSNSAGTFACNQLMYTALHLIGTKKLATRCGFIHVPCAPGYVAAATGAARDYPSLSVDLMVEAVATAIAVSLRG